MTTPQMQGLAALVRDATGLKDEIDKVATQFRGNIGRVKEALGHTQDLSDQMGKVADELQSAVGLHGNMPPKDEG